MLSPLTLPLLLAVPVLVALPALAADAASDAPDPQRVAAVAAMLPEHPVGVGRPLADRAAWQPLAAQDAGREAVARAEALLKQPLPEQTDDLFLDFSRTGNRTHCQNVLFERRGRLTHYVLAECLEDQGRFLPALEQLVASLCAERTWVLPAHDGGLENFNGKRIDIDLASSALGWQLATAYWMLGEKLTPETRQLIHDNLFRRVIDPYREMVAGRRPRNWWMLTTNNWNAVCLAGVTGATLAMVEPREERAWFVVAADNFSRHFLAGFTPDGYCSEGLGYWNYGFGHYVLLAETIRQATGGGVDLLGLPEAKMPATFGARIQILGGVSPAFADCGVYEHPEATIMYFLNRRFGLGLHEYDELDLRQTMGDLNEAALFAFPNGASQTPPAATGSGPELRTWFDRAGILIGRPRPGPDCRFGVALKGGNNAEHHNHNDVGSYVVVAGSRPVLVDPGAEVYTARTFSARRYESKLLNSYGHAVPVVAGKLQREGIEAHGVVLKAEFTDDQDTLQLDISSCYTVPELKSLKRTFVYSRAGAGSLTVRDEVEFTTPQQFATALITLGRFQQLGPKSLFIYDVDCGVRAEIESTGSDFALQSEVIQEDGPHPTRIGINLTQPVTSATVTVRITPAQDLGSGGKTGLLRNGDFELQDWCWELPADGLGTISGEQAAGGKYSLKITDRDTTHGSNITSARMPALPGAKLQLRGQVFHVSGSGLGMYVHYLSADGRRLNPADAKGNISPVGSLSGAAGRWEPFAYDFTTPPGTAFLQVWIHSYDAAQVEAYLDNLEIVPAAGR